MQIKLLTEGGDMKPGPTLSQKIGPLGINVNQVLQKVNDATKEFQGMKVPVKVEINPSTKEIEVKVFSPPISELLKKELGIEKGSGAHEKLKVGNASIEQIIKVAKTKSQNLLCNDLKSCVKTVAGSCVSLGILIENKPAAEIEKEIDQGKFDKEIGQGLTKTPEDKKKKLDEFFKKLKADQDKKIALEAQKAEAEKAKKEEAKETKEIKKS